MVRDETNPLEFTVEYAWLIENGKRSMILSKDGLGMLFDLV